MPEIQPSAERNEPPGQSSPAGARPQDSKDRGTSNAKPERDANPEKEDKEGREQKEGSQKGEEKEKGFHLSKKLIVIGILVPLVLITGGIVYWLHARQFVSTDDAYTTGHVHQISARISGIVAKVDVDDNQLVETGAALVELDPQDYDVSLDRARAGLAQAEAQVENQKAKIDQSNSEASAGDAQVDLARAQVAQSRAQLEKAQLDYARVAGLYQQDRKAVAKTDVDAVTAALNSARSATDGARANVASAAAQADSSRANSAAAATQLKVAQANVAMAQAAVRDAELQRSYCTVVSPVRGRVSKKTVETGQQLAPGQALMAIVPEDVWILANLKETQLTDVRVGQRVDIRVDSLPKRTFSGTVESIQEGSGATFSLLPPDNATGNFTKIVQRVPVKIVFDEESIRDFREQIVPGISAEPRIDLRSLENNKREPKRQEKIEKQNRDKEAGK